MNKEMNPSTEQLVREIAAQLGTTAEHLWGVLIRQAAITAAWNITMVVAMAVFLWLGYRLIRNLRTGQHAWDEVEGGIAIIPWSGALVLAIIVAGFLLSEAVICLANPEFWVLKQVLGR